MVIPRKLTISVRSLLNEQNLNGDLGILKAQVDFYEKGFMISSKPVDKNEIDVYCV